MKKNKKQKSPLWELQNREVQSGNCPKCGEFSEKLTVDHIFPESLLIMWGLKEYTWEDGDNLELICRACNVLKFARFDFKNPKTIPLIEKYLKILRETYN